MPTNPNKPGNKAPKETPSTPKKEVTYNGGGWGGTGKFRMQRPDRGQDFEIEADGWVTSPGTGKIVAHASDGPFPNGFGSPYAVVEIKDGPFAIGNGQWYVGHANKDVRPVGTQLKFGDPIARANNSLNSGWGWVELGKWDGGPHEFGYGNQFRHLFEQQVTGPESTVNPASPGPVEPGASSAADIEAVSKGAALSAFLQLPSLLEYAESQALKGQRSLMNDQPLLPFVEQVCTGSLRSFMSLPNGDFYAFVPDYFGGLTGRQAYWEIDDIEILSGQIELSDDALATHVYVVGDTSTINGSIDLIDKIQTAGVVTIFNAFAADFITGVDKPPASASKQEVAEYEKKVAKMPSLADKDKALSFLKKYGARPYYEEAPMIRSHFFEMFVAYQRFCLLWSKQFLTTFEFTFMPELIPGGIVKFPSHGIQCYIDEVVHEGDYENGFVTRANLSAPAAIPNSGQPLQAGMIRGGIFNPNNVLPGEGGKGNRGQS